MIIFFVRINYTIIEGIVNTLLYICTYISFHCSYPGAFSTTLLPPMRAPPDDHAARSVGIRVPQRECDVHQR